MPTTPGDRGVLSLRVRARASVNNGGQFEYSDAFGEERDYNCTQGSWSLRPT